MSFEYTTLLPQIVTLAKQAGAAILTHYHPDNDIDVDYKQDQSPVTAADLEADRIITEHLKQLTPHWPVMSEEGQIPSYEERQHWEHFWCVDPLDGTKGFIRKTDDFVVNIALVKGTQPVLGVVYVPTQDVVYYAHQSGSAYRQAGEEMPTRIDTRKFNQKQLTVAVSRFHKSSRLDPILEGFQNINKILCGSAIKSCYVAEGKADISPRLGPTSAWDTAAAQCIVEQAGGKIIDLHGQPLRYNTQDSLINPSFLVIGDPSHDWLKLFHHIN